MFHERSSRQYKGKIGNVGDDIEQLFDLAVYSLIYKEKRPMEGMQFPRIASDFGEQGNWFFVLQCLP